MILNYLKIAWRNTTNSIFFSLINITGLAAGMGVVIMIGLWIQDELSYDKNHENYDRIARVIVHHNFSGEISSHWALPFQLGKELREKYSEDFEKISMGSWNYGHFLKHEDKKFSSEGTYAEPAFIEILSLKMIRGSKESLNDPHSIIIDASLAKIIFGDSDPIGKVLKVDFNSTVSVTGVYEDLPRNSTFSTTHFVLPWDLFVADNEWVRNAEKNWSTFSFPILVQLKPRADLENVSSKIKGLLIAKDPRNESKPELSLHPMSKWHLYARFENGINTGGDIQFVWLFGIIGAFVLLLACINFMNLSTARSEKRAKEVGLRKAIGSVRSQLVVQFLSESLFYAVIAFLLSLVFVQLTLTLFNELADKKMTLNIDNPFFWMISISFVLLTGLLAGSYPALYLSSFKPVNILKGTFRVGRSASIPRKVLVVTQFTVSLTLMIGTIIVYRQIMHAKDRPMGYDQSSLITTYGYPMSDNSRNPMQYDYLKNELLQTGAVVAVGKSSSPTTGSYSDQSDFEWEGKVPGLMLNFAVVWCSHDYGNTIGLQYTQGRGFSRDYASDTASIVLNEAAVEFMGLRDPVGKIIRYDTRLDLKVIGVVKNVLMESPYEPVRPTVYMVNYNRAQILTIKLNRDMSAQQALARIDPVFKKFRPESMFEYQFVDAEFNRKFMGEERIGTLALVFATLAIFISCLGIYGLASFVAEQRTKEIGIRKILGASVFRLWQMLSKDFISLVVISCFLAVPVSYYFLSQWLQKYSYRTEITWWIFGIAGGSVLLITLITVSYQSIKAAVANPVDSLRNE